jgi:hypothetical protein
VVCAAQLQGSLLCGKNPGRSAVPRGSGIRFQVCQNPEPQMVALAWDVAAAEHKCSQQASRVCVCVHMCCPVMTVGAVVFKPTT